MFTICCDFDGDQFYVAPLTQLILKGKAAALCSKEEGFLLIGCEETVEAALSKIRELQDHGFRNIEKGDGVFVEIFLPGKLEARANKNGQWT
jgi:hypothetical protein